MNKVSFRELDGGKAIDGTSVLEEWYKSVRDTPISEFSEDDLCRAIRQQLYLTRVLPIALRQLQKDPLSGALWDGELASVIAGVTKRFWQSEPELASQAKEIMQSQDYSFDEKTREDVQAFLQVT